MSDLESELRNMQPAAAEQSEAELMYQCGWEAALAQQEAKSKVLAPSVSTAGPLGSQKRAFSFANFAGGTLFGAAVCLFLSLNAGLWSAGQARPGASDILAGNPPTQGETQPSSAQPEHEQEETPVVPEIDGMRVVDSMREFAAGIQSTFAVSALRAPILLASKDEAEFSEANAGDSFVVGPLSVFGNEELSIRAQSSLTGNPSWFGLGGF